MRRVRRRADLQTFQIVRRAHRPAVVGQVAPTDIPCGERLEVRSFELLAKALANWSIEHSGRVLTVIK